MTGIDIHNIYTISSDEDKSFAFQIEDKDYYQALESERYKDCWTGYYRVHFEEKIGIVYQCLDDANLQECHRDT